MNTDEYLSLKQNLIDKGYAEEIDWAETIQPCESSIVFFQEFMWVVLSSGMKNQIARMIWDRIIEAMDAGIPISDVFGHKGKIQAIETVCKNRNKLFEDYQQTSDKLLFLESLPWIGKITKYHLAKNLGLDFCKPDRHLVRIAEEHNTTPTELCEKLSVATGDRIGTVDQVIWRSANLGII